MLWPFVLPIKITFWALAVLVSLATLAAPRFDCKRGVFFRWSVFVASLAFVPSCSCIQAVLDTQRFGIFEYKTLGEVNDFRVERYLPPAAQSITVDKHMQGFRAKFSIAEADLANYLDELWDRYGKYSIATRREYDSEATPSLASHNLEYGDLAWPWLEDAIEYHGPTASNGAGFVIWYSPSTGIAYEHAGYW